MKKIQYSFFDNDYSFSHLEELHSYKTIENSIKYFQKIRHIQHNDDAKDYAILEDRNIKEKQNEHKI